MSHSGHNWSRSHHGGYLKDYPQPHNRLYSGISSESREIRVTISRWYGIGVHYYVNASEEDNPIVLPDGTLLFCWDDNDSKGRSWLLGRFVKYRSAKRAADRFADRWRKKEGYSVVVDDCEDEVPFERMYVEGD